MRSSPTQRTYRSCPREIARPAAWRSAACPLYGTRPATWPTMVARVSSGMPNSRRTSLAGRDGGSRRTPFGTTYIGGGEGARKRANCVARTCESVRIALQRRRLSRRIERRYREAKAPGIDRAREVENAVLASPELQLRDDGENVDHGAASPGQRWPFSANSRCACASAASSLTSIHGSSCGYASTA